MLTTDEIDAKSGNPASGDSDYEFTSAWALRGTEGRTIAKRQKDGWELHTQNPGTLRTEIIFRRAKHKNAWQQSVAFLSEHWAAFGRLTPMKQQLLLAVSCGLVVLGLVAGIVVASVLGTSTSRPTAATTEAAEPADQAADAPSQAPAPETTTGAEPYVYQGPQYEIIVADANVGPAALTQYWVLTSPLDYSTNEYQNQIKMIVADIARENGTAELMVEVVTDREVALAEAVSTYQAFDEEHGADYAVNVIPQMEVTHWAASYRGGVDPNTGQAREATAAYEIIWRPYATSELETWKPAFDG